MKLWNWCNYTKQQEWKKVCEDSSKEGGQWLQEHKIDKIDFLFLSQTDKNCWSVLRED